MTTLAIVHPTNLLGKEIQETLEQRRRLWSELRLLSTRDDEIGSLTQVRGAAAMVQRYETDSLGDVDLAFFCGPLEHNRAILEALPPTLTAVVASYDAGPQTGRTLVAGVNLEEAYRGEILLSPHPAAVAVAHLLAPLAALEPVDAVATVIQPASMADQDGLDELFEQTRAILAFSPTKPEEVFGHQLAFNVMPATHAQGPVAALVRRLVPATRTSVQLLQGAVFHGCAVSLRVKFAGDPGLERLREALDEPALLELADDEEHLGPIDSAARDEVLLGPIRPDPAEDGAYWIWAVMDNLTRGGALNALAIAEAVLGAPRVN